MTSLIICTYNRSASLKMTLASVANMALPASFVWELIVVDNNSKDDTPRVVSEFSRTSGLNVRYVFEKAQGLSHARNRGIREAAGDIIVFTDDDVKVDKSWFRELVNLLEETDFIAGGGKTLPLWLGKKPRWYSEEQKYGLRGVFVHFDLGDQRCETKDAPFGANMAFRKSAFSKYGLFRTDLGRSGDVLAGGEDTEFFRRLMSGKERVGYSPSAIVYHPIPAERLSKAYVQSVFFEAGKTQLSVEGIPAGTRRYFGVPRYLFPMMAQESLSWMFSFDLKDRFSHKLSVYQIAGLMAACRQTSRSTHLPLSRVQE